MSLSEPQQASLLSVHAVPLAVASEWSGDLVVGMPIEAQPRHGRSEGFHFFLTGRREWAMFWKIGLVFQIV